MKLSSLIAKAAVLTLLTSAPAMAGVMYDFTFTSSGGMDATGTIDVSGGLADFGSITVTGVPVEASPSTLLTLSSPLLPGNGSVQNVENHNGDVVSYDNLVTIGGDPGFDNLVLDGDGLGFGSGQYDPTHYNTLIELNGGDAYGNPSPGLYTLFVGEALLNPDNTVAVPEYVYYYNSGSLTLIPEVGSDTPEPMSLSVLLVGGTALMMRRTRRS